MRKKLQESRKMTMTHNNLIDKTLKKRNTLK